MNEPRLIQKRDIIRGVRDKWLRAYQSYADNYRVAWVDNRTAGEIRRHLHALDLETCSEEDVNAAINAGSSWVSNDCDMCGQDAETTLRIGQEPDYEARWLDLCENCVLSLSVHFHTKP